MAIRSIVMNSLNKEIKNYAEKIKKLEKQEAHVKTGALRDSISVEKISDGHYKVGVDSEKLKQDPRNIGHIDYAPFYYYGHKAYTIRPVKAKALRWVGNDGKVHFAKSVRIPAHAGDPFILRAYKRRPKL